MGTIPEFTDDGLLPPGDFLVTLSELRESLLVVGPATATAYPHWDAPWRAHLVDNLEVLVRQLWQVGVTQIFIDGSFAEDKDHPNKIWTWDPASRRPYRGYPKRQLPMWHQYRVELYPHFSGLPSGIRDRHGNELEFPSAFRRSRRDGKPRGIVKILGPAGGEP